MKILFYMDSFGLGHITRDIALIRALGSPHEVVAVSRDHHWMIKGSLPHTKVEKTSIGLRLAPSGLGLDAGKTRGINADFVEHFESGVEEERRRMEKHRPDVIIADIPAEVFPAAESEGIPVAAVSNFGWTLIIGEIFGKGGEEYRLYADAYSKASRTFVLPFNEPMEPFAHKERAGLLRRRLTRRLPKRREGILTTFGKSAASLPPSSGPFYRIPETEIESQDFVASASAIFTKPAYGVASEAVPFGIPLFFRKRPHFPESGYIARSLGWCRFVPEDAEPGEWISQEINNVDWEKVGKMKEEHSENADSQIAESILSMP